ncbi:hypothetical protein ACFC4C_21365 [Streptomyces sp. NPDC056039]|uniref:hypothetical protein n=1 Tax=Streptomyces sp. NPDC056039 TaxID=3345687 RepID=UPI0035DF492B
MEFSLRFDLESLEISHSGSIWGGVWIESADVRFPEYGWNDMAVAFTCELLSALKAAREGGTPTRRIRFYDGPFWLIVGSSAATGLTVKMESPGSSRTMQAIPTSEAVEAALQSASGLLDACLARHWGDNPDVRRLSAIVA